MRTASFLSFRKKRVRPLFTILQKNHSFGDTVVLETSISVRAKHLKVLYTVVFSETAVLLEYFKNKELPNGA
jgi:hypothetical protein